MDKELKLSAPRTAEDSKRKHDKHDEAMNDKATHDKAIERATKVAIDTYKEALKELEKY